MAKYKETGMGVIQGIIGEILIKHLKKRARETQRKKKIAPVVTKKPSRPRAARNPFKIFRRLVRNTFARLRLQWFATLTEEQRQAWEEFARKNILRDPLEIPYTTGGFQWFIKKNLTVAMFDIPFMPEPPRDNLVQKLESFSVSLDSSTRSVLVSFTPSPLPENHRLLVMGTGWINATVENWLTRARKIYISPVEAESPLEIGERYIRRFGLFPAGSSHAFRGYLINMENFAESNFIDTKTKAS